MTECKTFMDICDICVRSFSYITINIQKFQTQVTCQKGIDTMGRPTSDCFWRSSLIRVFPVCFSDKNFVTSNPDNQYFIWEQKTKSVPNFWTFTRPCSSQLILGPEVIKLFSCSTQLRAKFILLINVKMPTIVDILTFSSMIKNIWET